jgi:hypothetical protein
LPSVILLLIALSAFQSTQQYALAYSLFPAKPSVAQELGCSPTLSVLMGRDVQSDPLFYFDPLGLATVDNFPRLREAELKAGRVCMAALLQTMAIPFLHKALNKSGNAGASVQDNNHATVFPIPGLEALSQQILSMNGGITTNGVSAQDLMVVAASCLILERLLVMPEPNR